MKLLLLGTSGQVGWELHRSIAALGELVALGRDSADFEKPETLLAIVRAEKPQVIVNAVAFTAVDKAESEPARAEVVNAEAPGRLAEAAREVGALLVHYSTDYVFDGESRTPYREDDPTNPQNAYGRTKLAGEEAIRASGTEHLIFRTSWVHAARGNNFVKTLLRLARERDTLTVVDDQFGAPTAAELIADVTAIAVRRWATRKLAGGTYHLTAAGQTSWFEFARFVIGEAMTLGMPARVSAEAVAPIPSASYPVAAKRPANSVLACSKLCTALEVSMPDWRHHARRTVRELVEKVEACGARD